ncbi:hypothetical protein BDP27DRAFT_944001, partial [Rhodocollybia butyracea]
IIASIAGFVAGLVAWLVTTATLYEGVINVTTTGANFPMLAGNLASIGVGGILAMATSLIWPDDFDFNITRAINNPDAKSEPMKHQDKSEAEDMENKEGSEEAASPSVIDSTVATEEELDPVKLQAAFRFAAWSSLALLLVLIILIPLPLFFAQTIYGVAGFSAWVIIGIIWTFTSTFVVVLYPLWESREALQLIGRGIIKDIFANGSGKYVVKARSLA